MLRFNLSRLHQSSSGYIYKSLLSELRLKQKNIPACWVTTETTKPLNFSDELSAAKPFSAIPGPRGLPLVGNIFNLWKQVREDNSNDFITKQFEKHGPIYKEKYGSLTMVNICDMDAVEKLHRQEGKYPRRIIVIPWRHWRDEQGLARGLLTEDGPEWKRMRTLLDKQMLRPKLVATYTGNFNEVVTDFIERLKTIRQSKGDGLTVPNIDQELFHWSLETAGTVLFETRLGGLSEDRLPEIGRFIKAVQDVFISTEKVVYFPVRINRIFLTKWQKLHEDSWDITFRTTQRLIDKKFAEIQNKLEKGEDVSGFLSYLMTTDMSKQEIYSNISEIMLAAVDTTSNTMQWVLYELSRRLDLQQQLHSEVTSVAPVGQHPSYDNLQAMPLLKAIVKEALRLYPVTSTTSRVLEDDIVLCGYHIPANTTVHGCLYVMARDPKIFPDPLAFKPERWLRNEASEAIHNFAWLPFGFGPRSCLGRRVAELEMHLLLARISQIFVLKPADDRPLRPKTRGILCPERPVNIQFIERNQ